MKPGNFCFRAFFYGRASGAGGGASLKLWSWMSFSPGAGGHGGEHVAVFEADVEGAGCAFDDVEEEFSVGVGGDVDGARAAAVELDGDVGDGFVVFVEDAAADFFGGFVDDDGEFEFARFVEGGRSDFAFGDAVAVGFRPDAVLTVHGEGFEAGETFCIDAVRGAGVAVFAVHRDEFGGGTGDDVAVLVGDLHDECEAGLFFKLDFHGGVGDCG